MFAATPAPVRRAYFAVSCGMDLRPGLDTVTVPAAVLAGSADRIIKPSYGEQLARLLPAARFEQVPGAGHMLPLERPEHVVRAVAGVS
jgi:pimeloyl-ACP methyl ester carboxylesterase